MPTDAPTLQPTSASPTPKPSPTAAPTQAPMSLPLAPTWNTGAWSLCQPRHHQLDRHSGHHWSGQCNSGCARSREVTCKNSSNGETLPESSCPATTKLAKSETCVCMESTCQDQCNPGFLSEAGEVMVCSSLKVSHWCSHDNIEDPQMSSIVRERCPSTCGMCGGSPTAQPSMAPTTEQTVEPTIEPTSAPTPAPTTTAAPTAAPTTPSPTAAPTPLPTTAMPTDAPTLQPTMQPTLEPTAQPTGKCLNWCPDHSQDWTKKCTFAYCGGCTQCR